MPAGLVKSELQLAPRGAKGPEFGDLKAAFEWTITQSQSFVDQTRSNYLTQFALWAGQSADGRKWSREGAKTTPTPWNGASDMRVFLVDDAVKKKVSLLRMAFRKATLIAEPITGKDIKQAKVVSNFMRWMIHTQIPGLDREIRLLANILQRNGIAATGQFWETKQEKTLVSLTVEELQGRMPDMDMMALLMDESMEETLAEAFEKNYGCTPAKARSMIRDLREDGKTTVATLGKKISRPVIRTFDLAENLFIPADSWDLETCSGIYRVEYYQPEALRAFVQDAGWDADWVEQAIEKCRGKQIVMPPSQYQQPINRSFIYQTETFLQNQIGVVYAYQRLSDEEGVPGVYCTVFSPLLPPEEMKGGHKGYAKFGLLDYAGGGYPFTLYRREYISRRMFDTRGLPEAGKSWQDVIKAHVDSRVDAASIAIIPPMAYPMGRQATRWGPGSMVPERNRGEYHFLDRPQADPLTETSQDRLQESFNSYNGFASKEGDPFYAQLLTQDETDEFLLGIAGALTQVYELWQQYGDPEVTFRVMGLSDAATLTYVKDPTQTYRFFFQFDTQSTNPELMEKKWAAIIQGIQMLDRNGNVNYSRALQAYFESIDPTLAELILEPTEVGQARVFKDEQEDLTKIYAGFNVDLRPTTPPQLAMQAMQTWMQSPDVAQKYQQDQAFRERVDARAKQVKHQADQQQNKQIGKMGGMMPGPVLPTQ